MNADTVVKPFMYNCEKFLHSSEHEFIHLILEIVIPVDFLYSCCELLCQFSYVKGLQHRIIVDK